MSAFFSESKAYSYLMRRLAFKSMIVTLLVASTVTSFAQQKEPLSKAAMAAKQKVESLRPQAHITVIRKGASEEFGNFISHDGESFSFFDVDQKRNIKLKYSEVNKIKNGYGGYNSDTGQAHRPDQAAYSRPRRSRRARCSYRSCRRSEIA